MLIDRQDQCTGMRVEGAGKLLQAIRPRSRESLYMRGEALYVSEQ